MAQYGEGVTPPEDLIPFGFPIYDQLPGELFRPFMSDRGNWMLHHAAIDQFDAFVAAANAELGVDLVPIPGSGSAYRTYDRQKVMFEQRYVKYDTGRGSKWWNGTRYWLRPGMAGAATPGTSIHGLGLAVDFSNGGLYIGDALRRQLQPIAARFALDFSVRSENWHVVCVNTSMKPVAQTNHGTTASPVTDGMRPTVKIGTGMPPEDPSDDVAYLQTALREKAGQDVGASDGRFGEKTLAGVLNLQRFTKLKDDGIVGPQTWSVVNQIMQSPAPAPAPTPVKEKQPTPLPAPTPTRAHLKIGSESLEVAMVQRVCIGASQDIGNVDGKYGPRTAAGVTNLQRYFKLEVTGEVHTDTWVLVEALDAEFSKPGGVYAQKGM